MNGETKGRGKLVQFGAGNIGRSFIGQVFSRGGYEVVFVDIDIKLIERLNSEGEYRVVIKRNDRPDEILTVGGVRGVDGRYTARVAEEIAGASYISTSVGKGALPHIMPVIAKGLEVRMEKDRPPGPKTRRPGTRPAARPLDIIIAENIRNGADFFRSSLAGHLPEDFPLDDVLGLVETSIGKMVPIMREEDLEHDPLWVFAEEYNTLIVAGGGFKGPLPDVPGLKPVKNITAYVDRKLFIHNLGHAAAAYLGYRRNPDWDYIWEPLEDGEVYAETRRAMEEAAAALNAEYPADLPQADLEEHIDDLLTRFRNRALGDTVYRVGRDLNRKLGRNDRLVGAMLLAEKHSLPYTGIAKAVQAAFTFRKTDEEGNLFPGDEEFASAIYPKGPENILAEVCGLDDTLPEDAAVMEKLLE